MNALHATAMVEYQRVSKNDIASPLQLNTKQNLSRVTATPHTNPAIISCNGPISKTPNYETMHSVTTSPDTTVTDPNVFLRSVTH